MCTRDWTVQNKNAIQPDTRVRRCLAYSAKYPSFTPEIYSLSTTSSIAGQYTQVFITGRNFQPFGTTFVQFGTFSSNIVSNMLFTFYSSNNISFVVPLNATTGNYNVSAVNIYNGNFSFGVNQSSPGNLNVSNSISFTLT